MAFYPMIISILIIVATNSLQAGFFGCVCGAEVMETETSPTMITIAPAKPIAQPRELLNKPQPHATLLLAPSTTKSPMDITPRSRATSSFTPTPGAPRSSYRSLLQPSPAPITRVEEIVAQKAIMTHQESFDKDRIITYSPQAHAQFEHGRRMHAAQFAQAFREQWTGIQKARRDVLDLELFRFTIRYIVYKDFDTYNSYSLSLDAKRLELFERTIINQLNRELTDQQVATIIKEVSVKTHDPKKITRPGNGRSLKEEMIRKSPIDRGLLQTKINEYEIENNGLQPSLPQFAELISVHAS